MSTQATSRRTTGRRPAARKRRGRKRRWWPGVCLLLLVIGLVAIGVALFGGYEGYVRSTFRLQYYDEVLTCAEQYGIEPSLVYGVIRTESNFDPDAHSSADAFGLMQVTESTLEWAQHRSEEFDGISAQQLFDPQVNIRCGVYVLSLLSEMFDDEDTVIAAYNAGLGNVQEWLENPAYSDDGITLHTIPFEETRHYVQRVRSAQAIYQNYYHVDDALAG